MIRIGLLLLTAAVLLACPAAARAGTAQIVTTLLDEPHGATSQVYSAIYTGAAGERNVVRVTGDEQAAIFTDTGAPALAGPGCTPAGPDAVSCAAPPGQEVLLADVQAGDEDDDVTTDTPTLGVELEGGDGDDRLTVLAGDDLSLSGGAGDDVLTGGSGQDLIFPGPGADVVDAGAGDDFISGDDGPLVSADRIDGGSGRDTISYAGRTSPVRVDLAHPGHAGAPGEDDVLANVENVEGGKATDWLAGDDGPNHLTGAPADTRAGDTLIGRGGGDTLEGSAGADVLSGGAGDDVLSGDGGDDRYDGGPGADDYDLSLVADHGRADVRCSSAADRVEIDQDASAALIHGSCPVVSAGGVTVRFRHDGRGGLVGVAVRQVGNEKVDFCRVRVALSAGGRRLATATLRVAHGVSHRGRLKRVAPGRDALVTVTYARRCGGSFADPVRFYVPA